MTQDESDIMAMLESELTPVVTVPAPGGELTILKSKHFPEAERLARAESMLHGMIEVTENALENPRPGISNKLLPRPSQLAKGVSDVAKRLNYEMRHKESLELLRKLATGQENTETKIETVRRELEDLDIKGLVNESRTAANLGIKLSKDAKNVVEGHKDAIEGYENVLADLTRKVEGATTAANAAKTAAEKAAKKPTTVINAQPGATVNVVRPPRTDAGGTHSKTARGWRTQEDMAADFSKSATKIRGKWYGKVTVAVAKDWEVRYPNEARRERKSRYHAGLRNAPNPTPKTKTAYCEAAANWNAYWKKHNDAFLAWLKTNPNGDHATFLKTWERPGKTVHRNDTDKTMRYGADTSLPDALDSGDFDNET